MSAPVLSWLFIALGKAEARMTLPERPSRRPPKLAVPAEPQSAHSHVTLRSSETPRPNPQSQSFSRSYGSILPTSLIYIILLTRGCSPWRPDAVMGTTRGANKSSPLGFSRAVESAPDTSESKMLCQSYNLISG